MAFEWKLNERTPYIYFFEFQFWITTKRILQQKNNKKSSNWWNAVPFLLIQTPNNNNSYRNKINFRFYNENHCGVVSSTNRSTVLKVKSLPSLVEKAQSSKNWKIVQEKQQLCKTFERWHDIFSSFNFLCQNNDKFWNISHCKIYISSYTFFWNF